MSKNCDHENKKEQEKLFNHNYPGLDFTFKTDDLPKEYLDRLASCMTVCERITSLLSKYKISKRKMIHLTMHSEPMSEIFQDPQADESLKQQYREIKAKNVAFIYNDISAQADAQEKIPITIEEMFKYHQRLFLNIPQHPSMPSAQYRKGPMKVVKDGKNIIVGTCCQEVPVYMERLFYWLDSDAFKSEKGSDLGNAFIKAIVAHMYFISIHPFYDGNGSLSRFLQYAILRNAGVSAQIAHLLANYYNETREEYCRCLNAARDSGDVTIFLDYAFNGLSQKLNAYLKEILQNFAETIRQQAKEEKFLLAKGFTILEILVVLAVLAILIGTALPRVKGMQDQVRITKAQREVGVLKAAMESYKITHGEFPNPLKLISLVNATPQLIAEKNLIDPFGNYYISFHPGDDSRYYVIYSRGLEANSSVGTCALGLDSPTGNFFEPVGCNCILATNAPVASMTPQKQ